MTTTAEFLASLKVGDQVAIHGGYGRGEYHIDVISKVGKRFFTIGTSRYRTSDGYLVNGDRYTHWKIVPLTDEIREIVKRRILVQKIIAANNGFLWNEISTENLQKVVEIISAAKKNNG